MKERGVFHIIALISALILWAFIFFCAGLMGAQSDMFARGWNAFTSGELQAELLPYAKDSFDKQLTVWKTAPDALQGGALLIGSHYSQNPALLLVNDEGKILHQWRVEKKIVNPELTPWWGTIEHPDVFAIDDAHLLPQGDVIFIQDFRDLQNYRGQRLARMDKDSHILWQVPGFFHHEFDIAGDPQRIYAMASHMRDELPVIGPKHSNVRYLEDRIEVYTMDGKKIDSWSIIDAFAHSPYRSMLSSFEIDVRDLQRVKMPDGRVLYDMLHLNSLQHLNEAQAKSLPFARAGDLLISLRGLNTLAVFRPDTNQIVWAMQGVWRHQHMARVMDDGKLCVYDNDGSRVLTFPKDKTPTEEPQSRVICVNPVNNQVDEIYASPLLHSFWRGYYVKLADSSWIISSSEQSRVVVLSPEKNILWELRGVPDRDMQKIPYRKQISTVRYYPASALQFLNP